ncbi:uncharacterized protein LOC116849770 [Odontomachus brunneus]|uniref:uncharacterized protein LOC116849770 n=1 Tax=Odontomachus brunneus TaxID=486640 RepID=UPI0013F1EBB9|nr:uncharacterized protein LOC116849770 [Odontomachus brunneus]XP_032683149.1 uncharacterized protein LOC116849770 [Odontomachus brunneus]
MSPAISFCLLVTTLALMSAVRSTTGTRYKITVRDDALTRTESKNLRTILNYVRNEQRMYPTTMSLVYLNTHSDLVDFVSKYVASESIVSYKITTSSLSWKSSWQNRVDLIWILIVDDIDLLDFFVHEQSHIWKATNQYLIIITAENVATREPPREIFQSVWRSYNVHRIVTVSIQEEFRCLSRYFPFEKNQQSKYGVVRKICPMDRQADEELYDKVEKLNGYPIRVIVFQSQMMHVEYNEDTGNITYTGLDADVMFLLEKMMEATFRIEVIHDYYNDDPFHSALQHIEDGESDLIVTSYFLHEYEEYHQFEFTTSFYEDQLCLIAPAAGFMPKSYMPILPFTPEVWALLAAYNFFVTVLWFLIKYYSVSFRRRNAIILPLTIDRRSATKGLVTVSTSRQPDLSDSPPRIHPYVLSCFDLAETWCYPLKENGGGVDSTTAQKALLLGTLFFGLIVTGLYQSCLVSSLSDPFHYPELKTLEDVANSNLTIVTKYDNLKQNTFTENTTLAKRLKNKVKVVFSDKRTNDMVAFGKDVIALGRYASIKLDNLSNYFDEDGNELLHIVEEFPTTYLLSYVVQIYSPYRERINDLLLRMQEAGLVGLWYRNMVYPMYADEQRRKMAKSDRRIKLTLEYYSLTFLGLSLGLLCCAIVFLAELYFANRLCRKTRANFRCIAK